MKNNIEMIASGTVQYGLSFLLKQRRYWILAQDSRIFYLVGFAGLCALTLLVVFYRLGDHGIVNGNESLYIESAREMLLSRNFAIPTLNGLPYLEKPPLLIWLLAFFIHLFGTSEWVARLVTALATLALIISISRFSKLLRISTTGISAGLFLITSVGIDVMSRVAMPDMLLTTLFTTGCINFLAALQTQRRGYLRLCAALLGAASLIKGFLPIVLFTIILATFYWQQDYRRADILKLIRDPVAVLLLFSPMILWLIAIEFKQPGAIYDFIINEHVLRYLGMREPHDYYSGSVFYYVPRLFLFFFPWGGVLAFGWWATARSQEPSKLEIRNFLWLCVWIPFGFFSLSSAKANYYIILCLAPMAMLVADYLPALLKDRQRINLAMAITVPVMILIALWTYRLWALSTGRILPFFPARDGSLPMTIGIVLVLALIAVLFLHAGWRRASIFCLGGVIIPLSLEFDHIVARAEPLMSARTMATYIQNKFSDRPVFLFQDFESFGSLPIYLQRAIPVIDSTSADLYSGHKKFPDHPNFLTEDQAIAGGSGTLIVVMHNKEQTFMQTKLQKQCVKIVEIGSAALYIISATR